jgi:hypothetical protein
MTFKYNKINAKAFSCSKQLKQSSTILPFFDSNILVGIVSFKKSG